MVHNFACELDLVQVVSIYVPTVDNAGAARADVAERVAERVADLGGGATVTDGIGYWYGAESTRLHEPVRVVMAIVADDADLSPYRALAQHVKLKLAQESVLFTVAPIGAEFV